MQNNVKPNPLAADTIKIPSCLITLPKFILFFDKVFDTAFLCKICTTEETFKNANQSCNNIVDIIYKPIHHQNPFLNKQANIPLANSKYKHRHTTGLDGECNLFYSNITKQDYINGVEKCKQYITQGDCFQVVPSLRLAKQVDANYSPFAFYRRLRSINPSPFMFYIANKGLDGKNFYITGASPEIMVRLKDNKITIRPLAGTRKKTESEEQNKQIATQLLANKKEVSEHLILLDLGRNDVSKVSTYNSVICEKKMEVEFYSHVIHISSTVTGLRDQKYSETDILLSGMPAGTVSGGPKVRAMQIIKDIELVERSFYSGCLGYISKNVLESCIMLRTALIKDNTINLQAGAGVVYDSNPEDEYQECINKMMALIKAS